MFFSLSFYQYFITFNIEVLDFLGETIYPDEFVCVCLHVCMCVDNDASGHVLRDFFCL